MSRREALAWEVPRTQGFPCARTRRTRTLNPRNSHSLCSGFLGQVIKASSIPIRTIISHKQIFAGGPTASMRGFVQSYYDQQHDLNQSKKIMYYFQTDKLRC